MSATTDIAAPQAAAASSVHDLCTDPTYNQPRVPLEAHAWWFPITVKSSGTDPGAKQPGASVGHAHTVTCVPYQQRLTSDILPLRVDMMAHLANVPVSDRDIIIRVHEIQVRGKNDDGADILVDRFVVGNGASDSSHLTCDFSLGADCYTTVNVDVDLVRSPRIANNGPLVSGYRSNGVKQLRVTSIHEIYNRSTGELIGRMRALARSPFVLDVPQLRDDPANPPQSFSGDYGLGSQQIESAAWFVAEVPRIAADTTTDRTDISRIGGYVTTNLVSKLKTTPYAPTDQAVLDLRLDPDPCGDCIVRQERIESYSVHLDPTFPDGAGTVVAREYFDYSINPKARAFRRTVPVSWAKLSPGLHKVVVKTRLPMSPDHLAGHRDLESTLQSSLHIPIVIADTAGPTITMHSPTPSQVLTTFPNFMGTEMIWVVAGISDDLKVDRAFLALDGKPAGYNMVLCSTSSCGILRGSYISAVRRPANGSHQIAVTAVDTTGNSTLDARTICVITCA